VSDADFQLRDRVCLVTGGAGILGEPMCAALLRHGGRVAILDRDPERVAAVVDRFRGTNEAPRVMGLTADIRSREQVEKAAESIESALGPIEVLINNAAAKSPNFFAPFESFPIEDWDLVMGVNVTGTMICSQVIGGAMARRRRGSIVNTLSVYGIVAPDQRIYEGSEYEGRAINTPAIYSASKAALWGLTKYLATYWGAQGVRVNAITPGGVFSGQNEVFVQRYSARVPLGRMAEREEMSGAVVFLASDASTYVTGQNLVVDGGLTAW
jgi:NAD(P)-dependent dehydrogenase (short-subunit alcohol dehydrogenase family)